MISQNKYRLLLATGLLSIFSLLAIIASLSYAYFTSSQIDRYYFKLFTLRGWTDEWKIPTANIQKSPLLKYKYTVQSGDTLWHLAKKFDISIDTIVSYNQPRKVHIIPVNTKIEIPYMDGIIRVQTNRSFSNISKRSNIPLERIAFFNPEFKNINLSSSPISNQIFVPGAYFKLSERLGKLGAEFLKPLKNIYITSSFGIRIHPITKKRSFHKGIDLRGRVGELVYSAKGGRVIFANLSQSSGLLVIIQHSKGLRSYYAHLSEILVKPGLQIGVQTVIGKVGKSGRATGPHLHFEIHKNGKPINPRDLTDFH